MTPEQFQAETGVSRETLDRLRLYADLLEKWQQRINLVGPATLPDLWRRHMLDSAQLWPLLPPEVPRLIDIGSGAGFPGLVLAILGVPEVHLIESDQRKGAFLREVARQTGATVTVHSARIEAIRDLTAPVVTARALAALPKLLDLAVPLLAPGGVCLFLKGQNIVEELTSARKTWIFDEDRTPSRSDSTGLVLRVREVRPK
ncbi:16S rRNA (guanine(527)-N(7))-methyltransferase RsmG [Caenispirillum bisanense]|uniref:16S rRNA (guanine(527)-N(7))-methyltransferase RsmG n=1 Tax=Caenispirillum bisanense TaxID=414052 RepID=UPI0031CDD335